MWGLAPFHGISSIKFRYPRAFPFLIGSLSCDSCETGFSGPLHERSLLAQGRRGHDMTRNSTRLLLLVAATLFFSSVFPSPAPAQTVSFIARVDYAVGANPASVAVGDFNGDGVPDLAVANYGANTVSVLLGNRDGTFQPALTFATTGFNPEFVAVGDINRDGRLDLAVAHSGSTPGTVSVLLGNGDEIGRASCRERV